MSRRVPTALALLLLAGPVLARERSAQKQLPARAAGFDFAGLSRLFDDARAAPGRLLLPEEATAAPLPPAAPAAALAPGALWRRQRLIVPNPVVTPAYRRTFEVLIAHPEVTDQYDELILKYASAYHVDERLLKAIIAAESEFFIGAVSPRGARGLMQLMPATAREFGIAPGLLSVPEYNIAAGAAYIANLMDAARKRFKLKGVDFRDAPLWLQERIIAAYNAGPRFLFTRSGFYPQTRTYVRKVLLFYHSRVTDVRRPSKAARPPVPVALTTGTLY